MPISVFDIVEAPLIKYANDPIHPEDWRVDTNTPWKHIERHQSQFVPALEESPDDLWLDAATRQDRSTPHYLNARTQHQSLYLIRPTGFRVEATNDFNPFEGQNQRKRRAYFTYRNQPYSLGITDPQFIDRFVPTFPGPDQPANITRPPFGDRCLLCVSLTPLFNGFHYKIVAAVLQLA